MSLAACRGVVVPATGAAAGRVCAERSLGRAHLRHLLLRLAQPAPGAGCKLLHSELSLCSAGSVQSAVASSRTFLV